MKFLLYLKLLLFLALLQLLICATANAQNKPVMLGEVPIFIDSSSLISAERLDTVPHDLSHTERTLNNCGVRASFTPGKDSFFAASTFIQFTNTSTNATNIRWVLNKYYGTTGATYSHYFTPGSYELSLIASNGNCSDTFTIILVCSGYPTGNNKFFYGDLGFPDFEEKGSIIQPALDSGFILGGTTRYKGASNGQLNNGLIIKTRKQNCVEWSRLLMNSFSIEQIEVLKDSGYLISASEGSIGSLLKLDKNGNTVWKKTYANSIYSLVFKRIEELEDGGIICSTSPFSNSFVIVKLDAQGNLLWNKFLQHPPIDYINTTSIFQLHDAIYVTGTYKWPDTSLNYTKPFNSFIIKLNPASGDIKWTKEYEGETYRSTWFREMLLHGNELLAPALDYNTLGGNNPIANLHWLDTSGNIIRSKALVRNQHTFQFPSTVKAGVMQNGRLMLFFKAQEPISLQPGFFNHNFFLNLDSTSIYGQKRRLGGTATIHENICFTGEGMATTGNREQYVMPWGNFSENFTFARVDSTLEVEGCFTAHNIFTIQPRTLSIKELNWSTNTSLNYNVQNLTNIWGEVFPQIKSACPEFVDSCAILRISGPKLLCKLDSVYTYKAGKNNQCPQPVEWMHEGGLTVVNITDSSISVRYPAYGIYKIAVVLRNNCNPVKDSMFIEIRERTSPLDLGADTTICPGNQVKFHASPKFFSYKWQDGSTDSTLTVSDAGLYWVEVTDTCGNVKRDSVRVTIRNTVAMSIGEDRVKCNNDTIHLHAPDGFLNYTWTNNYNISSTNSQHVIVNPLVDTAYYLMAEKLPGCFAYDTIRIRVYQSRQIDLGTDQKFCTGSSASFDAGTGFVSYLWNNGATSSQITVSALGNYSVIATTMEGCKSYDTVAVTEIFSLPVVNLDKDPALCIGNHKVLHAGNGFASYTWNDGSSATTLTVRDIGLYYVEVTDANGCKGSDSSRITTLFELPKDFLPADTAICSYGSLDLQPLVNFNRYLWSNGAASPSIKITEPGIYWLEVSDENDCKGRDSVTVNPKDCMKGFYIPTAFTPNYDGKNDRFNPLIFGIVKSYKFTVFNRWGEIVFISSIPGEGWDGNYKSKTQPGDVFVWTCSYQLENEPLKLEKGTVVIIR